MKYAVALRWYDTHTKFHTDRFRHSSNITVITLHKKYQRLQCWYYWWEALKYAVEMSSGGMIYIVVHRLVARQ
jgi:hypothetical protein